MFVRFLSASLLFFVTAAPAFAQTVLFGDGYEAPQPFVMGYYVGYQRDLYPLSEVDFGAITHLMVGRVTPNNDGTLDKTFDIDAVNGPIFAQQSTAAAHNAGRKAVLMVGGAGSNGWTSAASSTHRAAFVANLLATMDQLGFDGLDLDWEPFNIPTDGPNMLALVQALRAARPAIVLTYPVGWINTNFETSDAWYGTVAPYFDRINIMSYDMNWYADGWNSWFTSALDGESPNTPSSIDSGVAYYLASGVPAGKLGIGIGFYGECWQGVTGPRQAIPNGAGVVASDNVMTYANIVSSYYTATRYHYDATAQQPWLGAATGFGPNACTFVTYEDPTSIAAKGAYVKSHALGGAIIWTVSQGYIAGNPAGSRSPLLTALKNSMF